MNGKNIIAMVLQLGSKVRCDLSETRLNKAKTGVEKVLSNWEVKYDPDKGVLLSDIKRFAGDTIEGKEVVTVNAFDKSMTGEGGFRVLFYVTDTAAEQPKPVKK